MKELLRADFYRLFKSKLVIVSLILCAAFPLVLALMFLGLREMLKSDSGTAGLDVLLNSHILISSSFSFTNNIGIILPVFATILVSADVSSGTLRNKLIAGHSRHRIFASHYIAIATFCLALIGIYASMTVLWGGVILGLQPPVEISVTSYVYFYVLGFLSFAFVAAVATALPLVTLNQAASNLLTIFICLTFGIVSAIISALDFSSFEHVIQFLPGFVVACFQTHFQITTTMFLEGLAGTLAFGGLFYALGTIGFSKVDLK